jgi:hypothetical protein
MWRTAADFIALVGGDRKALASRAKYYRAMAGLLLGQVPSTESPAARDELMLRAAEYENLATQLECAAASESPGDQVREFDGSD